MYRPISTCLKPHPKPRLKPPSKTRTHYLPFSTTLIYGAKAASNLNQVRPEVGTAEMSKSEMRHDSAATIRATKVCTSLHPSHVTDSTAFCALLCTLPARFRDIVRKVSLFGIWLGGADCWLVWVLTRLPTSSIQHLEDWAIPTMRALFCL